METVTISKDLFYAMCALSHDCGRLQGEDTIGALMKIGGFHYFEVANASKRIDEGFKHYHEVMWPKKLAELKEKYKKQNCKHNKQINEVWKDEEILYVCNECGTITGSEENTK